MPSGRMRSAGHAQASEDMIRFVEITKDNFDEAIQLRPKRSQYRFTRRETVLYSLAKAYVASRPDEYLPCLIEENGRFVGSIRLRNYGHGVGFAAFFIERTYQRRGLGRKALLHLIEWVTENYPTATEIETAVDADNEVARRLYESVGFHYTGVENDGCLDMEMQLTSPSSASS